MLPWGEILEDGYLKGSIPCGKEARRGLKHGNQTFTNQRETHHPERHTRNKTQKPKELKVFGERTVTGSPTIWFRGSGQSIWSLVSVPGNDKIS